MATLALGGGGSSLTGVLGNNAIGSALGLTSSVPSPLAFATKFGEPSIFSTSSLAYNIRAMNNFDVLFHWFPKRSQIRTYFANAFTAADTDDIKFIVRNAQLPDIINNPDDSGGNGGHFKMAIPGKGVTGSGELTIEFLATEFSFVDHIFYQWISETESPFWIYSEVGCESPKVNQNMYKLASTCECVPFTRADIEIKYYSSNNKELHSVICYGAFPINIETMDIDQNMPFKAGYKVRFTYDSIIVSSPFIEKSGSWGSAVSFGNAAGWTSTIQDDALSNYLNQSLLKKASRFMNSVTNKLGGKITDTLNNAQKSLGV